ncbi:MAG: 30S ribosomal protein S13 [archaeon]
MAEEAKPTQPHVPIVQHVPKPAAAPANSNPEFRDLVRIVDKDIKGNVCVFMALTHVRGVDFMMANAVCSVLGLDKTLKTGDLTQEQIDKIEDAMKHPEKYGIPSWLYNRRKDIESGVDKHLVSSDLKLQNEMDIRLLRKIRVYRGIRHAKGSKKVRGQRTRSTGRKGGQVGVIRKKKGAPEGQAKKLSAAQDTKKEGKK